MRFPRLSDRLAGSPGHEAVDRFHTRVFALAAVIASVVIMVLNRQQWFFHDDFVFAFERELADPGSFVRPHFGHITALPAIVFRLVYRAVGLHSFWPYQGLVVASHVGVAAVLRAVMRRCGVAPFVATSAAILFLFFGSGRHNLTWAFQTTLNGSIVFGLGALLVADHDGPVARRDLAAGVLLCASVLCSSLGPFMAGVVAVAVVLRRGPKPLVPTVVPPLVLFAVWHLAAPEGGRSVEPADVETARVWGTGMVAYGFRSLTHVPPLAVLMVVAVVLALAGVARGTVRDGWDPRGALPVSIVVGLLVLAAALGVTRGASEYPPFTPRYAYLAAVFCLPTVAWSLSRLAAGRRPFVRAAGALLLLGLPANVARIDPSNGYDERTLGEPELISALAEVAAAEDATRGYQVYGFITNDGLIDAYRSGRVPSLDVSSEVRDTALIMVALGTARGPAEGCRTVDHSAPVALERGDRLDVDGARVQVSLPPGDDGPVLTHLVPDQGVGRGFDVVVDRIDLVIRPVAGDAEVRVCRVVGS